MDHPTESAEGIENVFTDTSTDTDDIKNKENNEYKEGQENRNEYTKKREKEVQNSSSLSFFHAATRPTKSPPLLPVNDNEDRFSSLSRENAMLRREISRLEEAHRTEVFSLLRSTPKINLFQFHPKTLLHLRLLYPRHQKKSW